MSNEIPMRPIPNHPYRKCPTGTKFYYTTNTGLSTEEFFMPHHRVAGTFPCIFLKPITYYNGNDNHYYAKIINQNDRIEVVDISALRSFNI
jgi:hypothetical protein